MVRSQQKLLLDHLGVRRVQPSHPRTMGGMDRALFAIEFPILTRRVTRPEAHHVARERPRHAFNEDADARPYMQESRLRKQGE